MLIDKIETASIDCVIVRDDLQYLISTRLHTFPSPARKTMKQLSSALSSYQKARQAENHNGGGKALEEDVLTTAASSDATAVEEHAALYASLSWENGNISNQNDNIVGQSDDDGGNDYCDGHAPPHQQDHLDSSCQERLISASPDLAPIFLPPEGTAC